MKNETKTFYYLCAGQIIALEKTKYDIGESLTADGTWKTKATIEHNMNLPPLLAEDGYSIGETLQDAQQGKYVLLDATQAQFHLGNPTASAEEVWNAALTPPPPPPAPPTLEQVKQAKIAELVAYDSSPAVNTFYLGNAPMWLTKEERIALKNRLDTEEALSKPTTKLWFGSNVLELPIPVAKQVLLAIEGYAIEAYDVTATHAVAIQALETSQEVQEYDYTADYPTKPTFTF